MHKLALRLLIFVLPVVFLSACSPIGLKTVAQDRFGYADAYSESWKHQMLLNMVKIRYADAPVFLEVSSIISQYLLEAEIHGNLSWNAFLPTGSQFIGARGRYADRPTITYQPLIGEKFTRSLMTPLPPSAVLSLVQSGRQVDLVLRICVDSVNGIYNRESTSQPAKLADTDFYRITASLRKIQQARAIGIHTQETEGKKKTTTMVFRKKGVDPETQAEISLLKKLLGLNPELQEFKIVYGALARNDQEIAFLSRSMLDIFQEMGSYIEVPEIHVAEKRVSGNFSRNADIDAGVEPLMRIQSTDADTMKDAFVSVRYRGNTFWIDDRDYQSKRFFSFMMFLLTLAETGAPSQAPIVTIPVG
jgi:hypothetical protein